MIVGILSLVLGLGGLVFAAWLYRGIVRRSTGDELMTSIAAEIQLGAMTYLRAQYVKIGIFALVWPSCWPFPNSTVSAPASHS